MSRGSTNQNALGEPDEATRLLPDEERGGNCLWSQSRYPTPLPKTQLGALVAVRTIDPIAYTQIFPYINQLLADLHIAKPEQVGFYSGLIESAYSLAQVLSVYQLGRLSDIIGRRPVVIFGLIGIAVTTIGFGLSTSLATLLGSRILGGLVGGNIAVFQSILAEITDETNQNIAVPIYSLAWSTGTVIGPLIGGTFANAPFRLLKCFSWSIFVDHPHLLPCVISAICTLVGVGLGYFLIEETLPSKRKESTCGISDSKSSSSDVSSDTTETGSTSAKALLAIPALRALTLSGLALSFLSSAFDVVFTLFCYTPTSAGGLGLQPSTIGNFLAFAGTLAVLLRLVVMPYVLHRFDYATTYNTCMYLWPITFASLPLLNVLALDHPPSHSELSSSAVTSAGAGIWIGLALVLGLSKVAAIPYTLTMLLIKRHAPVLSTPEPTPINNAETETEPGFHSVYDPGTTDIRNGNRIGTGTGTGLVATKGTGTTTGSVAALGQSNGLVQLAMCLGRAIGPVFVSMLFTALNGSAWARRWGIGWSWSIIMVCFSVVGARVTKGVR